MVCGVRPGKRQLQQSRRKMMVSRIRLIVGKMKRETEGEIWGVKSTVLNNGWIWKEKNDS